MDANMLFGLFGGIGLFLFGMNIMAEGLQKTADSKMKQLLEALTKNKFTGVIVGALVTAILQSSSATTVMVVGFVNAGLMNLSQAVGIIMGANIGTTITSWIVSMGEWSQFLKPSFLAPVAVGIGSFMIMFSKKEKYKQIGEIVIGFGLLFLGIENMSNAMEPLKESEVFKNMLINFGQNPLLGILAGAIITALIQSSSASVTLLQTVAGAGLVPFSAAVYIIMGQNIGTCVTALISSIGASKNAKSAAYIHLLFNVIGSIILSVVAILYFYFFNNVLAASIISRTQISVVHTMFNVLNTVMLYNFSDYLIKIAEKITIKYQDKTKKSDIIIHLDDRILETPSFAIQSTIKEMVVYGDYTRDSLIIMKKLLLERDKQLVDEIYKREAVINKYEQFIMDYLVKISKVNTTDEENDLLTLLFKTTNDIERVGDHCENVAELFERMLKENIQLSETAVFELSDLMDMTIDCFDSSLKALANDDMIIAQRVIELEQKVDIVEESLRESHLNRLINNECNSNAGFIFLDTISNLERVTDHSLNISEVVTRKSNIKK